MQHRHPTRKAVVIAILLAGLPLVSRVEADFHLVQIDEVMAGLNGDATVQFTSNSKFDKQLSKISQIRSFCGLFHFVQGVFLKFLGGIFHVKPPK
jgi:hypothetical protein